MDKIVRRIIIYTVAFFTGLIGSFVLMFIGILIYALYWGVKLEGDPSSKIEPMANSGGFEFCSWVFMFACIGIALALGFLIDRMITFRKKKKK